MESAEASFEGARVCPCVYSRVPWALKDKRKALTNDPSRLARRGNWTIRQVRNAPLSDCETIRPASGVCERTK